MRDEGWPQEGASRKPKLCARFQLQSSALPCFFVRGICSVRLARIGSDGQRADQAGAGSRMPWPKVSILDLESLHLLNLILNLSYQVGST